MKSTVRSNGKRNFPASHSDKYITSIVLESVVLELSSHQGRFTLITCDTSNEILQNTRNYN